MGIDLFIKVVAIAEIIIQGTKDKIKIAPEVWASFVLAALGLLSIAYDIIFNAPNITSKYIFTCLGYEILCVLIPQISYDKTLDIINIIKGEKK